MPARSPRSPKSVRSRRTSDSRPTCPNECWQSDFTHSGHATPATAYTARPKALPGSRDHDTHTRVRRDIVDKSGRVTLRHNGRLHHIGIGRTHTRTRILLLVADLDIRIINAATGEILRHLTLDTSRDYQPQKPNSPNPT